MKARCLQLQRGTVAKGFPFIYCLQCRLSSFEIGRTRQILFIFIIIIHSTANLSDLGGVVVGRGRLELDNELISIYLLRLIPTRALPIIII